MEEFPLRLTILVSLSKVEVVGLNVVESHGLFIDFKESEAGVVVSHRCQRTADEVDANVLVVLHALYNAEGFGVSMTEKTELYYVLISVHQTSESFSPSVDTVITRWNVSNDHSVSVDILKFL